MLCHMNSFLIFDNSLAKHLISKRISSYLPIPKLNNGLALVCGVYFLHFFHENTYYLILYQIPKFEYQTFLSFLILKQFLFSNSCLDTWWSLKLSELSSISFSYKFYKGEQRKKGKERSTKFKYLENKKSFSGK